MANTLFPKGKKKILDADIDLLADTIKAVMVPTSYSYDASDEFLADLGTTIGTAQTLTTKTTTDGVFDADDITFPSVTGGSTAKAVILYKDTGSAATSPVIDYVDTITGFPAATNGGNMTITWDSGAYKIFSL